MPSPGATNASKVVRSQRPSWSCISCTQKKIKCDKVVPCSACIRRGQQATCRLSADPSSSLSLPVSTPSISTAISTKSVQGGSKPRRLATAQEFDALRQSAATIRQRLYHLELALGNFVPVEEGEGATHKKGKGKGKEGMFEYQGGPIAGLGKLGEAETAQPPLMRLEETVGSGDVEAAVTLEYLALGRDQKQDHVTRNGVQKHFTEHDLYSPDPFLTALSPVLPALNDGLPSRGVCDKIVDFALGEAYWQHCAVHIPTFRMQLEEFYGWGERRSTLVNQAWLALLFSLLCIAVRTMSDEEAGAISFDIVSDRTALAKTYYDAAVNALNQADWMRKHTIFSVQTVAVLFRVAPDIGGPDFSPCLLSTGIRVAQSLMLHRFTSHDDWEAKLKVKEGVLPGSPAWTQAFIDREVRKRLWAVLVVEDAFGAAYRRPPSINLLHCSTPPPLNCNDSDLASGKFVDRPVEEPTENSFIITQLKTAACIARYFDTMCGPIDLQPSAKELGRDIEAVVSNGPAFLQPSTDLRNYPPYVASMRRHILVSTQHKLTVMHRTYLASARVPTEQALARSCMQSAARKILEYYLAPGIFQETWCLVYHCTVGATALVLELFQHRGPLPPSLVTTRETVERAIVAMQTQVSHSPIAGRAVQLLANLLAEESARRASSMGAAGAGGKRSAEEAELPFGVVAKRVSDSLGRQVPVVRPRSGTESSPTLVPTESEGEMPLSLFDSSFEFEQVFRQDTQDGLDWLLTNTNMDGGEWSAGGEAQTDISTDANIDFWRVLQDPLYAGM